MNRNLVGSIYGRFSITMHILSRSNNKHDRHRQLLFLLGRFLKMFYSETAWPVSDIGKWLKTLFGLNYLDSSVVADCVAFDILPDKRNEINTILKLHTNICQG